MCVHVCVMCCGVGHVMWYGVCGVGCDACGGSAVWGGVVCHVVVCIFLFQSIFPSSDEGVSFPIQKGIELSRSKVRYFKHNNMDHLEELLEAQREQDTKVKVLVWWL